MAIAPPSVPYVPANDKGGRQTPKAVVLHGTVTSDNRGTARNVVRSWNTSDVKSSAHYVIDAGETIQAVYDHTVAFHCGYNQDTVAIEHCDEQVGDAARWDDADSRAILDQSAKLAARLCAAYGIEVKRPTIDELKRKGPHGIYGHDDSRRAFGNTTHTDPRDFPWTRYLRMVRAEYDLLMSPPDPVTTHTRWAVRETAVCNPARGKVLRMIPKGYEFQVIDGSGHGADGWVQTSAGNWVLGADTTIWDPSVPVQVSVMDWNVENKGDADAALDRAEISALLAEHKPHYFCGQELYRVDLSDIPGYQTYQAFEGYPVESENRAQGILVRDDVALKIKQALPMEEEWIGPKLGIRHDPRVHRYVTGNYHGVNIPVATFHVPFGADAVEETRLAAIAWLEEMEAAHGRGVIVGDWNVLADLLQARVGTPAGATVDGGGLDKAVFVGLKKVKGENLGNRGRSDHPVKIWTFES